MTSNSGPSGFAPLAQVTKQSLPNENSMRKSLSIPPILPSSSSSPTVKVSSVCATSYAHLVLEEETELFDQDPTLGRNGERDFSAGGDEYKNEKMKEQQIQELEATKGITPAHVEWPSLSCEVPSSALIAEVIKIMKEMPKC